MSTIVYKLKPGDKKGQMDKDERIEKAKKYIELIKSEGKIIVSEEWMTDKVVITTDDNIPAAETVFEEIKPVEELSAEVSDTDISTQIEENQEIQ